jgi:peptide/nickel transport system substrate-binding protein
VDKKKTQNFLNTVLARIKFIISEFQSRCITGARSAYVLIIYLFRLTCAVFSGLLNWHRIFRKIELKDRKRFLLIKVLQKFTARELAIISTLMAIIIICCGALVWRNYICSTYIVPKNGGSYTEGAVGEPKYVNPILASANDTDMLLCSLVFSGLSKYDQKGELQGDLASSWEVSEDNKTYTFFLRPNILWHDRQPFTSDDVVFAIQTIQNPDYTGNLANIWRNVEIEKIDDLTVKFALPSAYTDFLSNTTLGILPKHRLENVPISALSKADFNLQPIGTGPYKFEEIKKDKSGNIQSITLRANNNYYLKRPYINRITFKFYLYYNQLFQAYKRKEIQGLGYIPPEDFLTVQELKGINIYTANLPQYTAVFFNVKSKCLASQKVRQALTQAVDKQKIIQEILHDQAQSVETPILLGFLGYNPEVKKYSFNLEEAKNLLQEAGWVDVDGDGIRERDNIRLEFNLLTVDKSLYGRTAQIICDDWKDLGANVKVVVYDSKTLQQDYISSRNYDALLYGENLGRDPDPYAYWHSTQATGSGLNLCSFSNRKVDEILEEARQSVDCDFRSQKYIEFQNIIAEEVPAIFLFNPNYIYGVSSKVKGIDLGNITTSYERFWGVSNWYIKTKRVPK